MAEVIVDSVNFEEEVLRSDLPVLVDFWANWCPPCKMLGPVVSQLADEYEGKIKVAKIDVDQCAPIAMEYRVTNIPALKVFKDGKVISEEMGFKPLPALKAWIDPLL